ncbi:LysR family transcriptional regulator [Cognatiyoonia sp. IB215182]|uniref:LysR family transcriptional regulator n=1 Tax=Cognatiyoonia sp. IB215182 TaxID=3097353 RepID=UPI002A172FF2|nr:LysR family transcriptional regulator [Cognatiyoonia sp. IB215182]MDX8351668.1 LysR family transcriptional regulator [Cognatiyoonia sp. IB215182]
MDKSLQMLDWSLVQAFLAVAETGSLSGAARQLHTSQPTLGRQIKAMETQLGAELFHRQARGLALTSTGADLVAPAEAMRDAVQQISLRAAGQQAQLEGTVRITASVATASIHLPPIIAEMRRLEPQIAIELVPSDDTTNLLYREADIAVRMYRPTQLELVTQHLGEVPLGIFAAKSYLAERGVPRDLTAFAQHDFVGYDTNPAIIDGFKQFGTAVDRDFFKTRCDDNMAYLALLRAGCGIGFAQLSIGYADPELVEIDMGIELPTLPIWLTAHEAMRQTPRIRRVWDLLAEGLRPLVT